MQNVIYRSAEAVNSAMSRVYSHMCLAVITSMLVSYVVGNNSDLLQFFFTGAMKWLVIFAPLVAVLGLTFAMDQMSKSSLQLFLHGFAALMGLSLATIFQTFEMGSIVSAFMGAAVLFAVMSAYGYFTKRSLDSVGRFMFVGLIAIIIASVINVFVGSSALQMTISAIGIVVFVGLTAYDTQRIRIMVTQSGDTGKEELLGALTLYLDFVNLFVSLLQLVGDRK